MRYIDLNAVISSISEEVKGDLQDLDNSMLTKTDAQREDAAAGGNSHWRRTKPFLEAASNRKCWYTESKNPGCLNDVEHFRPKGKVLNDDGTIRHWYWFLAFNPTNYRLSSQFSNRLNRNPILGATGGKGDQFPLVSGSQHAMTLTAIAGEQPVILDPCKKADTELLEFEPDGRPVLSIQHLHDPVAQERVERSKLLLNLDYPTFNEDRERLYNKVKALVRRGDRYVTEHNNAIEDVKADLRALMSPGAEYSMAAECYIRGFRDRTWVEDLIL